MRAKKPHPRNKFTEDEDKALLYLVSTFGDNDWSQVALYMPSRSPRQCRERYKLYLSPEVNNGPWSKEEDLLLETLYRQHGPKWTIIAKHFQARTDVNIKSRWNVIKRRLKRENEFSTLSNEIYSHCKEIAETQDSLLMLESEIEVDVLSFDFEFDN